MVNEINEAQEDACCGSRPEKGTGVVARCPACESKGKAIKPITIESLVHETVLEKLDTTEGFRFCGGSSCQVAYYHSQTGDRILRADLRVSIGHQATEAPRTICYCFGHTLEEIEAEVAATGASRIADEITEKCRQGLDRCAETNPQGSCCLGNVRSAIKEALARKQPDPAANPSDCRNRDVQTQDPTERRRNAGRWTTGGAVLSAMLASACCWLPMLLIAFGVSAAGISGFFEAHRPHLLGVTGLLLAGGFYLAYFRRERCATDGACAAEQSKIRRINKVMLWVATTVVVVFALFPNYVGLFLAPDKQRNPPVAVTGEKNEMVEVTLAITGMT